LETVNPLPALSQSLQERITTDFRLAPRPPVDYLDAQESKYIDNLLDEGGGENDPERASQAVGLDDRG
jgi:hypothetical protein